jgi:PhnB protein
MADAPGYQTVTPYIVFRDAAKAIDFYKQAFGATERMRQKKNGKIAHAEIQIGNSPIMIVDEFPDFPYMRGAQTLGGSPVHIFLSVDDADAVAAKALAAGAKTIMEMSDKDYGRTGGVEDPFGLIWWITTPPKT